MATALNDLLEDFRYCCRVLCISCGEVAEIFFYSLLMDGSIPPEEGGGSISSV